MKCKNCGAEVPSGEEKCPYCHCEMPKEKQEVHITNNYYGKSEETTEETISLTTSICPKCGSNKIKFKREEIGSTNANVNKGKRVVHYRTVGVCQNCGFTYDANPTPEKKKGHGFWWWLLVICFFPISIPILLSKWFIKTDKVKLDKKIKIAFVVVFWFLYLVLIFAAVGSNDTKTTDTSSKNTVVEKETEVDKEEKVEVKKETKAETSKTEETVAETKAPKETLPDVPTEYLSAIAKAETYSELMHMSKQGIYDQLTSEYGEKFSSEAAEWAMENLKVDYKENALAKAKDYSDTMHMSKQGIYDQLTSEYGEKFTEDEAQYAVDNLIEYSGSC